MLENEPGSSGTAVSTLNHGGISPACDNTALLETSLWGLLPPHHAQCWKQAAAFILFLHHIVSTCQSLT